MRNGLPDEAGGTPHPPSPQSTLSRLYPCLLVSLVPSPPVLQRRWDRSVGNTLEQQGPFLWGLWLNALFCGPHGWASAGLGFVYVITRAYYPWVYPTDKKSHRAKLWLSTMPAYAVVALLWGEVALTTLG